MTEPHPGAEDAARLRDTERLLDDLNRIGVALSSERNVERLLETILRECMAITKSDGGTLYIVEHVPGDGDRTISRLRFHLAENLSRKIDFATFTLPLDSTSVAGHVASTRRSLRVVDVSRMPPELGLRYNDSFDKANGYRTISLMTIPMTGSRGEVLGVLQLVNRKEDASAVLDDADSFDLQVRAYSAREEAVVSSLASQAAVLLERTRLHERIRRLFRAFVEAMVTTIDRRDPATSGHSLRVANFAELFARAIGDVRYGPYADMEFSEEEIDEISYSALLHDIGKIGVREAVLQKNLRLSDDRIEAIAWRIRYAGTLKNVDPNRTTGWIDTLRRINAATELSDEDMRLLDEIAAFSCSSPEGEIRALSPEELQRIRIPRGNLTEEEREEIRLHPRHTFDILSDIPWPESLANVPSFAAAHHERLDGSGYPEGTRSDSLPLQARILAFLDVFDALVAPDRPYRRALRPSEAKETLLHESLAGKLDPALFEIFDRERLDERLFSTAFPLGSGAP